MNNTKINIVRKDTSTDPKIVTLSATLNPGDNGGEGIGLDVDFVDDDGSKWEEIIIKMYCYGTHSTEITLNTVGFDNLRNILNQMHEFRLKENI